MITINSKVPDMELQAFHNEEIKKIKLGGYAGKWLLLMFYPGDFTFVCPTELEEAAAHYPELQKMDVEILSISTDSVHVHKAWHDVSNAIKKVKFPMLADPTGALCREFGVYIEDEGVSLRGNFIINPEGLVKTIEINDNNIGRNIKETVRKIQATQFVHEHTGLVCPASWEPGQETLKPGLDLVGKI